MKWIKKTCIDRLLSVAKIEEIIGDFVTLKKSASHYIACCPFHKENTPSFVVYPATNSYICFSCGEKGTSTKFLMEEQGMTYVESLEYIGKKYNIEIEYDEESEEEVQTYKKKEALWNACDAASKEYVRQLSLPENAALREYAYKRWGQEFCMQMEIGCCPRNAKIAISLGFERDTITELGLINSKDEDFLSGRVTIPIKDKSGHTIGFTARTLSTSKNSVKYLNLKDSLIYKKSKSIFGIHLGSREARKQDKCYLMEGAPDCLRMQMIGVHNAFATLGTSWTDEHFQVLQGLAKTLCFLPDADPPSKDKQFGPGILSVQRNGIEALKKGFKVFVKQIPIGDIKQDPDTYCTSKEIFNALEEQDFIFWYADLLFARRLNTEQTIEAVKEIATLLSYIQDDTRVKVYLQQLEHYGQPVSVWESAFTGQRNILLVEEAKQREKVDADLLKKYGFKLEKNRYFSYTEKGGISDWSNFVMEPLFHIKDNVSPKRIFILRNVFGVVELVEMKQEELISVAKFKQRVEGLGNFIWMGSERELTRLKMYLYEKTETALQINQLGWQRYGFFAFGNGVFDNDRFIAVDDYGIVRLPQGKFYLPANSKIYRNDLSLFQFERKFVHLGLSHVAMREFTNQIFLVFGNNGKIGFIFYLATLFRDIVTRESRSFPILNLFGPKGSGKSELGFTLMSFFTIENTPPNLQNSTISALNDTVAAVSNALVHIDEFKNDLDIIKHEFLKGLWDGTGRTRMNMDEKKKETTSVDSGIILSGQEMPTADIALFSRLIFLSFDKSEFSEEEKTNFMTLRKMRSLGMTHLTLKLLPLRRKVEENFPATYRTTMDDINAVLRDNMIEDRILLNWLAPLAVFRCIETDIDTSISYKEMLPLCIEGIRRQNSECKQNNELADFWTTVAFFVQEGDLIEGADFRIAYLSKLKTDKTEWEWQTARPVLYLQKSRIFTMYKKQGRAVGENVLKEGSLKYYLSYSKEFLGDKAGVRFKVYRKGIPVIDTKAGIEAGKSKTLETVQRVYCFDYNALAETYGINLINTSIKEEETPDKTTTDSNQMSLFNNE